MEHAIAVFNFLAVKKHNDMSTKTILGFSHLPPLSSFSDPVLDTVNIEPADTSGIDNKHTIANRDTQLVVTHSLHVQKQAETSPENNKIVQSVSNRNCYQIFLSN